MIKPRIVFAACIAAAIAAAIHFLHADGQAVVAPPSRTAHFANTPDETSEDISLPGLRSAARESEADRGIEMLSQQTVTEEKISFISTTETINTESSRRRIDCRLGNHPLERIREQVETAAACLLASGSSAREQAEYLLHVFAEDSSYQGLIAIVDEMEAFGGQAAAWDVLEAAVDMTNSHSLASTLAARMHSEARYRMAKQQPGAEGLLERALEVFERSKTALSAPQAGIADLQHAQLLLDSGRVAEALQAAERALSALQSADSPWARIDPDLVSAAQQTLGRTYCAAGIVELGRAYLQDALTQTTNDASFAAVRTQIDECG